MANQHLPTLETDAAVIKIREKGINNGWTIEYVYADHARKMERERDAYRTRVRRLEGMIEKITKERGHHQDRELGNPHEDEHDDSGVNHHGCCDNHPPKRKHVAGRKRTL